MGYTVDMRLQQFRKVEFDTLPEFISFESPKGQNLIAKIIKEKFGEIYNPAKAMKVAHLLKKIGLF